MSEADMLLNNLSEGNESGSEPHFVVNPDRTITVPESLKKIAIQHDHNVETVTFDCFRYWDDRDLSQMQVYINYMRADKSVGSAMAKITSTTPTDITFDWTVSRSVTYFNGPLVFLVCMIQTDSEGNELYHWNSELNTDLFVGEGLEINHEELESIYVDLVTGLLTRMDTLESGLQSEMSDLDSDITSRMSTLETNLQNEMSILDSTLKGEMSELDSDIQTRMNNLDANIESEMETLDTGLRDRMDELEAIGVSHTVEVEDIENGYRITLNDSTGSKSVDIHHGNDAVFDGTALATKSTTVSATLLATAWTGTDSPFTITVLVSGVTTTSNQEILPAVDITSEQLEAFQAANIQDGGQAADSITLKAFGEKPTIDIPIRVILRGD